MIPSRKKDDDASAVLLVRMPAIMAVCGFCLKNAFIGGSPGIIS